MTEYIVTANKLNFRSAPETGDIIAVLPRGQMLDGGPVANNAAWLDVKTALPLNADDTKGFVAAQFALPTAAPAVPAAAPAVPAAAPAVGAVNSPTMAQMQRLAAAGKPAILQGVVDEFAASGASVGLTKSKLILCHFLAQACHESAGFRTTVEFWGPTRAQLGYEGRADLGNVNPGDGKRYMGRGIFQLTGRGNYRLYGGKMGLGIEDNPELAAEPRVSFRIACQFWAAKNLGQFAANNDIKEITRRINGGQNGLAERTALFNRAMTIF